MEVARSVEQERLREVHLVLGIELFDQLWRRREAQMRSPLSRVNQRKTERLVRPRVIQIEMKSAGNQISYAFADETGRLL